MTAPCPLKHDSHACCCDCKFAKRVDASDQKLCDWPYRIGMTLEEMLDVKK